jgi:osomolarity two-component system, response regulator SSK1
MEWGCMQALIDFDGWRKWKDFSSTQTKDEDKEGKKALASKKKKGNRVSVGSNGAGASTSRLSIKEEDHVEANGAAG